MSTLIRKNIEERVEKGQLITNNYNSNQIKEACYEAVISNDFFKISNMSAMLEHIENGDYYILRPNNQVVCITKEYFEIPLDLIARVLLVGHYFSLGIAPVNTYADPGFKGRLGIVLTNTSSNYLKIIPGEPIVKIEFSSFTESCENGYVGQHGGEVKIWPFRHDLIVNNKDFKIKNIDPGSDSELEMIYGATLKNTINEAKKTKLYFFVSVLISTMLPLLVIWGIQEKFGLTSPVFGAIISIVTGIVSNILFHLFIKSFSR